MSFFVSFKNQIRLLIAKGIWDIVQKCLIQILIIVESLLWYYPNFDNEIETIKFEED